MPVHSLREKEERMRQKFQIYMNGAGTQLNIKELAVIDNHLDIMRSSMLEDKNFSLLSEQSYDNTALVKSISIGIEHLVDTLRTINFFPNHQYAIKIAEAVVELYSSTSDGKIELFFDDKDKMQNNFTVFAEA
jgi:hypothetical protein